MVNDMVFTCALGMVFVWYGNHTVLVVIVPACCAEVS